MRPTIHATMEEAVADIPDGSFILVGGMGPGGYPFNLMEALYHQGAKDLTFAANSGSTFGRRGPIDFIHFHDQGRIKKQIGTGFASGHPSRPTPVEKLWREGKIEYELLPQGTLAERIRAAGAGIPAFYTPTGVGTEIANGKEYREFNGRGYILEEAMHADYALIHAWKADTAGNLVFRRSSRNFGPIMAQAARVTIVEVEEPIVPAGELDPDNIHCAGVFVQRAVAIGPTGRKNINIRELREQMFNEQQMAKVAGARQGGGN